MRFWVVLGVSAGASKRLIIGGCAGGGDPAMTSSEDANETGIVIVGKGRDGQAYVLEDLSGRLSPDGWARRAIREGVGVLRNWMDRCSRCALAL